jgi:hypothetical protein
VALGSNVQCESSWYVVKQWDRNLDVINPAIPAGLPSEISITSLASDVFIHNTSSAFFTDTNLYSRQYASYG